MKKWLVMTAALLCTVQLAQAKVVTLPTDKSGGLPYAQENFVSENEYMDASIHVELQRGVAYGHTNYMAVYITVANASQVRTTNSDGFHSKSLKLAATMAHRVNAVFAVNGDYFCLHSDGYLVRQGQMVRNRADGKHDVLIFDQNADMHILKAPKKGAVQEYLDAHQLTAVNSFNFGPGLIIDGEEQGDFVDLNIGANKHAQRTAIMQTAPLTYIVVSTEGPEDKGSTGLTIQEFADFLLETFPEVQNAYNLDGGSSSSLVFRDKKVNAPNNPKVRGLCDILYFASAFVPDTEEAISDFIPTEE